MHVSSTRSIATQHFCGHNCRHCQPPPTIRHSIKFFHKKECFSLKGSTIKLFSAIIIFYYFYNVTVGRFHPALLTQNQAINFLHQKVSFSVLLTNIRPSWKVSKEINTLTYFVSPSLSYCLLPRFLDQQTQPLCSKVLS